MIAVCIGSDIHRSFRQICHAGWHSRSHERRSMPSSLSWGGFVNHLQDLRQHDIPFRLNRRQLPEQGPVPSSHPPPQYPIFGLQYPFLSSFDSLDICTQQSVYDFSLEHRGLDLAGPLRLYNSPPTRTWLCTHFCDKVIWKMSNYGATMPEG